MAKLASTLGLGLIVLCGARTAADATRTDVQTMAPAVTAIPEVPAPLSTFAQGPSCIVPQPAREPAGLPARRQPLHAARTHARPVVQVTRHDGADATFELRPTDDGSVAMVGSSGGLQISKRVTSDGAFALDLSTGTDSVTIAASGQGTTVARNGTTISIPRTAASDDRPAQVHRLLAGSPAVMQLRRLGAALTDAEDRSAPGLAMVIADAAVGQLTGDVGAVRRAARYLAHNGGSNTRPASLLPDCFQSMEGDMMFALNDYAACLGSVWGNMFWEDLCAWRWVIEVESVWFTFIGCSVLGGLF